MITSSKKVCAPLLEFIDRSLASVCLERIYRRQQLIDTQSQSSVLLQILYPYEIQTRIDKKGQASQ